MKSFFYSVFSFTGLSISTLLLATSAIGDYFQYNSSNSLVEENYSMQNSSSEYNDYPPARIENINYTYNEVTIWFDYVYGGAWVDSYMWFEYPDTSGNINTARIDINEAVGNSGSELKLISSNYAFVTYEFTITLSESLAEGFQTFNIYAGPDYDDKSTLVLLDYATGDFQNKESEITDFNIIDSTEHEFEVQTEAGKYANGATGGFWVGLDDGSETGDILTTFPLYFGEDGNTVYSLYGTGWDGSNPNYLPSGEDYVITLVQSSTIGDNEIIAKKAKTDYIPLTFGGVSVSPGVNSAVIEFGRLSTGSDDLYLRIVPANNQLDIHWDETIKDDSSFGTGHKINANNLESDTEYLLQLSSDDFSSVFHTASFRTNKAVNPDDDFIVPSSSNLFFTEIDKQKEEFTFELDYDPLLDYVISEINIYDSLDNSLVSTYSDSDFTTDSDLGKITLTATGLEEGKSYDIKVKTQLPSGTIYESEVIDSFKTWNSLNESGILFYTSDVDNNSVKINIEYNREMYDSSILSVSLINSQGLETVYTEFESEGNRLFFTANGINYNEEYTVEIEYSTSPDNSTSQVFTSMFLIEDESSDNSPEGSGNSLKSWEIVAISILSVVGFLVVSALFLLLYRKLYSK